MVKYLIGSIVILALANAVFGNIYCYNCIEATGELNGTLGTIQKSIIHKTLDLKNSKTSRASLDFPICKENIEESANITCSDDFDRCIKIDATVKDVEGKVTLRTCGYKELCKEIKDWLHDNLDDETKKNLRFKCYTCDENNCNLASSVQISTILILVPAVIAYLFRS